MKSAGFLNRVSNDKSPIRKRIGFSFIFAIRSARIGENGIEMDKNDRKFNLPGGLTAGGFSLPATITARIGQSGICLRQTLQSLVVSRPSVTEMLDKVGTKTGSGLMLVFAFLNKIVYGLIAGQISRGIFA